MTNTLLLTVFLKDIIQSISKKKHLNSFLERPHMKYLIMAFFSLLVLFTGIEAKAQAITVIVNSSVEVKEMTIQELQEIFTLKRTHWANGTRIKIFVLPNDTYVARRFIQEVLQLPPNLYFDLVESAYAMGKTNIPVVVAREESLVIKIMVNSGSIGYTSVPERQLKIDNVTIIKVIP